MDPAEVFYQQAVSLQQPMWAAEARGDSEIRQFYSGTTVFLTGGTGFLGKQLIEKLIRSCDVDKVYILIRTKKNKTTHERLKLLVEDCVFDEAKKMHPNFSEKIVPIEGDTAEIGLGINDSEWSKIVEQVNIMFHVAATTRFDEVLQKSTLTNIRGTREMLNLAKQCKNLRSFVYVSTAYSQATLLNSGSEIQEELALTPLPPDTMIQMAERMEITRLIDITDKLVKGWPNTYTFTKAIAEHLVQMEVGNLPVCIVRPPIVCSTYKEPSPGWIDVNALYGPCGIFLSGILGILHVMKGKNPKLCLMPADYVNNLTVAAGRETAKRYAHGDIQLKIYNHSNTRTGFNWDMFYKYLRSEQSRSLVPPAALWYCFEIRTSNIFAFWLLIWHLQYAPAYIADAIIFIFRLKKPKGIQSLVKISSNLHKACLAFSYFMSHDWDFRDDNTVDLYNRMSETDKALFNFDAMSIDWHQLIKIWLVGTRKFIIKDGLKNTAWGVRKQNWFQMASYIIMFMYAFLWYKILCYCLFGVLNIL